MINLLPPIEKRKRLEERNLKIIWNIGILLVACFLILILFLLGIRFYLLNQIELQTALIEYEQDKNVQVQALKERVDAINNTLNNLNNFYETQFFSIKLIEEVETLLPEQIYLDTYLYQKDKLLVSISGYGDKVETIYKLRENFRKSELFKNIDLKLSDWLETDLINFSVSCNLDYEL